MKKHFVLPVLLVLLLVLAACGDTQESVAVETAETVEETVEGVGVYTFSEPILNGRAELLYTVTLSEDGGFTITQSCPLMEDAVYTGTGWAWHDSYFTTPLPENGELAASWYGDECLWMLLGDGAVQPMNYVAGKSSGADAALLQDVAYAEASASQKLDIYLPEGTERAPVIVVVHGGGFRFGDENMAIIQPIFAATERGYAVVSVDYRKSTEAVFPAAVADVKAAVRWVRANADVYGFDADNIAIWGESAGAYLAVMTALTPEVAELDGDVAANSDYSSAVQALVSFYAPVEFWVMDAQGEALGMSKSFSDEGSFESAFVGQAVGADEEYTYRTWWGTYADALPEDFALAAYIAAGDGDTSVPYTQSVDLADDLTEVIGAEGVTLNILEGANHEDAAFYTEEHLAQVYDFLDGVLK